MTADDQTPATDSERDEVRTTVEHVREYVDTYTRLWPDFYISSMSIADRSKAFLMEGHLRTMLAEHDRLTALIAEQAATIERVQGLIPLIDAGYTISRQDLTRALGSQWTEGHRG